MATYYLSPDGDDTTGDGSSGSPWLTATHAIANSAAGDTVVLLDGTYDWTTIGEFAASRTFRANNNGSAILDAGGASISAWQIGTPGADITLSGIVFKNAASATGAQNRTFRIRVGVSHTARFETCQFNDINSPTYGVLSSISNSGNESANIEIVGCLAIDCPSWVAFASNSGTMAVAMIGCTVYYSTNGNYVIDNRGGGTSRLTVTLRNNIMLDATSTMSLTGATSGAGTWDSDYNCFKGFTIANTLGSNDITSDPKFVDASGGDFALRSSSPCLFTGTAVV